MLFIQMAILELFLGWYIADLLGGLYHYILDNYGSSSTPIIGRQIAEFRAHHRRPMAFIDGYSWYDNIAKPVVGGLLISPMAYFYPFAILPIGLGIAITQLSHRWAHQESPPLIARVGQKLHLLLSRKEHAKHHSDFTGHYAVLSGWSNPLIHRLLRISK